MSWISLTKEDSTSSEHSWLCLKKWSSCKSCKIWLGLEWIDVDFLFLRIIQGNKTNWHWQFHKVGWNIHKCGWIDIIHLKYKYIHQKVVVLPYWIIDFDDSLFKNSLISHGKNNNKAIYC